jgi:hypothetical protein
MTATGDPLAGQAVKPQTFRTDRAPGLPPGSSVVFVKVQQLWRTSGLVNCAKVTSPTVNTECASW